MCREAVNQKVSDVLRKVENSKPHLSPSQLIKQPIGLAAIQICAQLQVGASGRLQSAKTGGSQRGALGVSKMVEVLKNSRTPQPPKK